MRCVEAVPLLPGDGWCTGTGRSNGEGVGVDGRDPRVGGGGGGRLRPLRSGMEDVGFNDGVSLAGKKLPEVTRGLGLGDPFLLAGRLFPNCRGGDDVSTANCSNFDRRFLTAG